MRARSLLVLVVPLALALGVLVGARATAQSAGPRWEYRIEAWTVDDTTTLLRALTKNELSSVEDMAQNLERGMELVEDARVQTLVQARLEERLAKLGAEGWEVFLVTDSRAIVSGVVLPAPRVYAKVTSRPHSRAISSFWICEEPSPMVQTRLSR